MGKLKVSQGVLYGNELRDVYAYCKEQKCAFPAVNVIGSSSTNAALEAARQAQSPIIVQFSNGGSHFNAGKYLDNTNQQAAIAGGIAGAHHIHVLARAYGVPVILHTDHCAKKLLPWVDGLIAAGEEYYRIHKRPLYSSHMLDLSEEPLNENIEISAQYAQRLAKIDMALEMELGVTGGEEDGVDNTDIDASRLYTQPEEVLKTYETLTPLGHITIAAAFGNTHGVYKPGNVKLTPIILKNSQDMVEKEHKTEKNPISFVFHGGSGSEKSKITESLGYGVVKMNIDTDTQWAFTRPIRKYMEEKSAYLQSQLGNPEGQDKPNKKHIDPRAWVVNGEKGITERLLEAYRDLGSFGAFTF